MIAQAKANQSFGEWFRNDGIPILVIVIVAVLVTFASRILVKRFRRKLEGSPSITQAINPDAIVQSNLTYSRGHGYYDDPYKLLDERPDHRRIVAWLTRWNQAYPSLDATLRLAFRVLHDSFGSTSVMNPERFANSR